MIPKNDSKRYVSNNLPYQSFKKKQKIDDDFPQNIEICTVFNPYAQVQVSNKTKEINKNANKIYTYDFRSKKLKVQLATYISSLENKKIPFGLTLKKLNNIGLSLFLSSSAKALQPGDFLGFYSGPADYKKNPPLEENPILSNSNSFLYEADISNASSKNKKIYSINPGNGEGNYTKYINHSCLEPNVEFELSHLPRSPDVLTPKLQIRVKVINKIEPGDMILINYGEDYWANMPFAPVFLTKKSYTLDANDTVVQHDYLPPYQLELQQELVYWRTTYASCPIGAAIPEIDDIQKIEGAARLKIQQKKKIDCICKQVQEAGITSHLILNAFGADLKRRGIFLRKSASPILQGDIIGIFGGEIEFLKANQKAPHLSYLLGRAGNQDIIVNATHSGNFTRFFNTAKKGHENVKAYLVAFPYEEENLSDKEISLPDQLQAVFFAEKNIMPGEQLLVEENENQELNLYSPMEPAQVTTIW